MRTYEKNINLNQIDIKPHNIVFTGTSGRDYEMQRIILLEDIDGLDHDEYLLLEGGHCSCYGFDETSWQATIYKLDELCKLAESHKDSDYEITEFWRMILKY